MTALLAYLDNQDQNLVMQAAASMYDGNRGLFCEQFIPYKDLCSMGYGGFRQFLLSMYEVEEHFMLIHKGEISNLKSQIQKLKGDYSNEY